MNESDFKSLVIEKAKEIFSVYGYKKTTMDDIAKACNKSKGLIYHHYSSKEEIFRIAVRAEIDHILGKLREIGKKDIPFKEKIKNLLQTENDWFDNATNIYNKVIIDLFYYIEFIKDIILDFHTGILEILKTLLKEEGIDNIEINAALLLQILMGILYDPMKKILNLDINDTVNINNLADFICKAFKV